MNDEIRGPDPVVTNTTKATVVGFASGASGTGLAVWLATVVEARYGVPVTVTASVLGTGFAFVTRWAAKLIPNG